jgi:hypothetical protein
MHLYSSLGKIKKYNTIDEIMKDYYDIRIKLYEDRKHRRIATNGYNHFEIWGGI